MRLEAARACTRDDKNVRFAGARLDFSQRILMDAGNHLSQTLAGRPLSVVLQGYDSSKRKHALDERLPPARRNPPWTSRA